MDFRPNNQPASSRPATQVAATPADDTAPKEDKAPKAGKSRGHIGDSKWLRVLNSIVLVGVAVLIGMIALALTRANNGGEFGFVNKQKYQAVIMQGGAVYFGNIQSINDKYIDMTNVYYVQTNSTSTSSTTTSSTPSYQLLQLGCQEVHDPYDQMIINRDQVSFWENIRDNGVIVTKINELKKDFPNGPDCSQATTQTQASDTPTQSTGTGTTGTDATNSTTNKSTTGQ